MAMVSADGSSQSFGGLTAQIGWFGLRVGGHPALSLHLSNEPDELSQWLCNDDSAINIVSNIIIISVLTQQWETLHMYIKSAVGTSIRWCWCYQCWKYESDSPDSRDAVCCAE